MVELFLKTCIFLSLSLKFFVITVIFIVSFMNLIGVLVRQCFDILNRKIRNNIGVNT